MAEYSILFVKAEENIVEALSSAVSEEFDSAIEFVRVDALLDGLRALEERTFDLIVSELFLPDSHGLPTVRHLKQQSPRTPIIILCHANDRDTAVNAVRKGAHDFFCYEELELANLRRAVNAVLKGRGVESMEKRTGADRRTNPRFPCRLAVSYQALEHPFLSGTATSETVNISSKGLLFTTTEALVAGQLLQVSVDWPARLENQVSLKLVAEGRVVRNANGLVAMRIDKYEFRTRRAKAQSASAEGPAGSQSAMRPKEMRPKEKGKGQSEPFPRTGTAASKVDIRERRSI